MFRKICIISILLGLWVGCTRQPQVVGDPKQRLTEYIVRTFSIRSETDKDFLLGYLTGDVKGRLESWSKEQFREAFIERKREFIKLTIREIKKISDQEVEITYELKYNELGSKIAGHSSSAMVTNKKLCQMVLVQGKWMISDVRNIKELLEFKDELSLP